MRVMIYILVKDERISSHACAHGLRREAKCDLIVRCFLMKEFLFRSRPARAPERGLVSMPVSIADNTRCEEDLIKLDYN